MINPNDGWPTFEDVFNAYKECRIGKPANAQQTRLEFRLGENLVTLTREIQDRSYEPSRSTCFVVTHPKPREIFAAHFRDRIVHHLVISRLTPIWEPRFSPSSYACRKGMGTHGAIRELKKQVRKVSQGGLKTVHVLQLDLASFFVSINRPILKSLVLRQTKDTLAWLIETIFESDARKNVYMQSPKKMFELIPSEKSWFSRPDDEGIPIGNLTSQFGANLYLNELDHFIKRNLKARSYIRYMDDLTFFDTDHEKLSELIEPVDQWLKTNRKQCLNPRKTSLKSLWQGIEYLGYKIKQTRCQSDPAKLYTPEKKKWEFIGDLRNLERTGIRALEFSHPLAPPSKKRAQERLASVNARLGLQKHAASFRMRKEALEALIRKLYPITEMPDDFVGSKWVPIKVKKNFGSIKMR